MPKIALISGDSSMTGAPYHVLQIAMALKSLKYDVLVVAPPGPLIKSCSKGGLKTEVVPMNGPFDRRAVHKIREILQEFSPKIAHFHGVRGGWIGRLAARKLPDVKKVYTEHLWTKYYHLSNTAYEKFQLNGLKFMDRWTDKTIAVSDAVSDFLISQGFDKKKIVVIPNGVRPDFLKVVKIKKPKEAPLIIGSVGSLNQVKNYRNMILAVARAKERLPDLDFHYQIIGEGPLKKQLELLVKKKKIEKTVHFLGRVDSISERLQHFSIFLSASFSESFGLAVAEAMAVGIPVIVSNITSLKSLVSSKCGIWVNPYQTSEIADALVKLLKDEDLRTKMGNCGKERVKGKFSEDEMVLKTVEVYKELL